MLVKKIFSGHLGSMSRNKKLPHMWMLPYALILKYVIMSNMLQLGSIHMTSASSCDY